VGQSAICAALIEMAGLGTTALLSGGSEAQKAKYLPPVVRGEGFACFALTEPGAGSDAAAIESRAERVEDGYVLNGRKRYASFAHLAEYTIVFAKTDPTKGARGISAFVVPRGTPGFKVMERIPCIGMRGHQDEEISLENCRLPRENLIGEEGKGLRYALGTLDETRTTLTCGFIGLARAAFEEAVKFAKARKTFGQSIAGYQAIGFPLADLAAEIEAARLLAYKAAWLADRGVRHTAETAAAKAFASQLLIKATNLAVEVHGGFGGTRRFPVERMLRDARIWVFAQGAPNIMRLIVARELFKGA
jgi:alkylation response protein AidB-like acyl-CoA dehydrogenase